MRSKHEQFSGIIITALVDVPLRIFLDADDDHAGILTLPNASYAPNTIVS